MGVFFGLSPKNTPIYLPCHGDSHRANILATFCSRAGSTALETREPLGGMLDE
jgi:hypothetical protein